MDSVNMGIMASLIQPTTSLMSSNLISKKDSNSDSSLSIDEMGVGEDIFSSIDSDSDGLVSQSELTTAIETKMSEFNGEMPSKDEFQSMLSELGFEAPEEASESKLSNGSDLASTIMSEYDSNGDSLLSSEEVSMLTADQFSTLDSDGDGSISSEELTSAVNTVASQGSVQGPPPGGGGGGGGQVASSEEEYDAMDTNQDGTVSLEELQAYYGTTSENSSTEALTNNDQNALDNLQLLMDTLKTNSEDKAVNSNSFDGLLKAINTQNNNSEINTYIQNANTNSSALFGYA